MLTIIDTKASFQSKLSPDTLSKHKIINEHIVPEAENNYKTSSIVQTDEEESEEINEAKAHVILKLIKRK